MEATASHISGMCVFQAANLYQRVNPVVTWADTGTTESLDGERPTGIGRPGTKGVQQRYCCTHPPLSESERGNVSKTLHSMFPIPSPTLDADLLYLEVVEPLQCC